MTNTNGKISVVLVDDQEVARLGLRAALQNNNRIEIVAEGITGDDAFRLAGEYHPNVLLFGLNTMTSQRAFNGVLTAGDPLHRLMKTGRTNVLVLSRYAHRGLARSMLCAGAGGFMLKDEAMNSGAELAQAIVAIARKRRLPFHDTLYEKLYPYGTELEDVPQLTPRRVEMMQTIADNPHLTLAQVANLLGIAESTLRNNLSAISRALDTPNANGAMIACLRLGLVQIH